MAEQIIDVENKRLVLRKEVLQKILLKDKLKNLPVVVLSVVGTYRQGKSFLLNFFLRFLNETCKENKDVDEWLSSSGVLSGFKWTHSSKRQTVGLTIWPEVFISRLPSGEEVAIILLDSQGTFDNQTSVNECAAIFALSALLSSFQIFNVMCNINFNELTSLKEFLKYGQLLREENSDKAPFQYLMFLIRDWPYPHEYAYGKTGGEAYLNDVLNGEESGESKIPEDVASLKKSLKTYFSKVESFLLPDPGSEVRLKGTDKLEEIHNDFKKHVQELISDILKPENLTVKKIDDKKVTVGELCLLIEKYYEHFQSGQLPDFRSIYEATAEVQLISILEQSIRKFKSLMNDHDIQDPNCASINDRSLSSRYFTKKEMVLREFKETKKMDADNMGQRYCLKLSNQMDALFLKYQTSNNQKRRMEAEKREIEKKMQKQKEFEERQKKLEVGLLNLIEIELTEWEKQFKEKERNMEKEKALQHYRN